MRRAVRAGAYLAFLALSFPVPIKADEVHRLDIYQPTWITIGDVAAGESAVVRADGDGFALGHIFPKRALTIDSDVRDGRGRVLIAREMPLVGVEGRYPAGCTLYPMTGRIAHGCLFDRDGDGRFDSFDAVMNVGWAFVSDVDAKPYDMPVEPVAYRDIDGRSVTDLPLLSLHVSRRYQRPFRAPGLFTCISYDRRDGTSCFGIPVSVEDLPAPVEANIFGNRVSLTRAGEHDVAVKLVYAAGGAEIVVRSTARQRHILF